MVRPGLERVEIHYYTVAIGALTGGAAPLDGHVDCTTPEEYGATTGLPTTNILSLSKERANMRFEAIIRQISEEIQPLQTSGVIATGADADTPASAFTFTVSYDRFEYLRTEDELNLGVYLTGADAIKRWVERALTTTSTANRFVYNPDVVPTTAIISGPGIADVVSGPAEATLPIASVVVTPISDVTDTK